MTFDPHKYKVCFYMWLNIHNLKLIVNLATTEISVLIYNNKLIE